MEHERTSWNILQKLTIYWGVKQVSTETKKLKYSTVSIREPWNKAEYNKERNNNNNKNTQKLMEPEKLNYYVKREIKEETKALQEFNEN